jgi:hypothetical protein
VKQDGIYFFEHIVSVAFFTVLVTATRWALLVGVLLRLLFWMSHQTGMLVLGSSTRTGDSVQGLTVLASARDVLPEEVSGPHTF